MSSIRDALRVQAIEKQLEELHALVNRLAERSAEINQKLDALEAQRQDRLAMVRRLEPSNSSRKSY
jgi:hypothetical protein